MGTAARVAGWQRRTGGVFVAPSAAASPDVTSPKIEIFVNEAWTDITSYVRYESKVKITRGRQNEGGAGLTPSTCAMTLGNPGGIFSPRQPTSPFYGQLGQNTPLRVSIMHNGIRLYRFYGEVSEWPPKSDISGDDVTVSITASGITRRLQQGVAPLQSALRRGQAGTDALAYWPMEDEGADQFASAVTGQAPLKKASGTLSDAASFDRFVGSGPLPTFTTGVYKAGVPTHSATGEVQLQALVAVPSEGLTSAKLLFQLTTTGSARRWDIWWSTDNLLHLSVYDADGVQLDTKTTGAAPNGKLYRISFELMQDGADIDYQLVYLEQGERTGFVSAHTLAGQTLGRASAIWVGGENNQDLQGTAMGHVAVFDEVTSIFDVLEEFNAHGAIEEYTNGENPTDRMNRLCRDNGISLTVVSHGLTGNFVTMGYQEIKTLVELVDECEQTDLGILFEPRDQIGLGYRSRLSLYNQDPAVVLSHAAHNLAEPLSPVDDDQQTRNDVTITRARGSQVRAVETEGPKSVLPPPLGVGQYDDAETLSIGLDSQLEDHAGWRLHLGTVDEARYPTLSLHLANPSLANDSALLTAILNLDIGDRVVVTDPPDTLPPDDISLLLAGHSETIDQFEHTLTLNCVPESPWRVGVADDPLSIADTAGSELAADVSDSATSFSVATTSGPLWTTDVADFPFDLRLGGEVVTVTAISGSSSPQTFTVTRSTNNVVKSHTAGTDIRLANPTIAAL